MQVLRSTLALTALALLAGAAACNSGIFDDGVACVDYCYDDGACITSEQRCDGFSDCGDGSDEDSCGGSCSAGQFTCGDGRCISDGWRCDGTSDCGDGSDEDYCGSGGTTGSGASCTSDRYACSNGECIPLSYVCDGGQDCFDGGDELGCGDGVCDMAILYSDSELCDDDCELRVSFTDTGVVQCTENCGPGYPGCSAGFVCVELNSGASGCVHGCGGGDACPSGFTCQDNGICFPG